MLYNKQLNKMNTLNTIKTITTRKEKTIEFKMSNMTFIVKAYSHYITARNSGWTRTRFSAKIKETSQGIGVLGNLEMVRRQMKNINSKSHLFLK